MTSKTVVMVITTSHGNNIIRLFYIIKNTGENLVIRHNKPISFQEKEIKKAIKYFYANNLFIRIYFFLFHSKTVMKTTISSYHFFFYPISIIWFPNQILMLFLINTFTGKA